MSEATSIQDVEERIHKTDEQIAEVIREHREYYERVAESDLPIAEDAQRALDWLENYESEG